MQSLGYGAAVVRVIPRVVIAGTSSGAGKTTVSSGLIGALRARGHTVQGFKVGPDYIDPSYHALASGRPGRNLDAFLSGPELIALLFEHGSIGADIAVVEGVMGLFDGASGRGELASTAHVAKLLDAPVILVLDGSAMARSAAAVLHGFSTFDPELRVAGVIFNRVGSDHHAELLREAADTVGLDCLGALRRSDALQTPERHLGLVPVSERTARASATLEALAAVVGAQVDLDGVERLARRAGGDGPTGQPGDQGWPQPAGGADLSGQLRQIRLASCGLGGGPAGSGAYGRGARVRLAIARGPAFSFHYQENLELLEAAGAELLPFDPLGDERLPDQAQGLLLAGGFPEVFGAELAANERLRGEIKAFAGPIHAECGGLLYLGQSLDDQPMCGVLPTHGKMAGRLTLGYREATVATPTSWLQARQQVRGHEFHYSATSGTADPAWNLQARGRTRAEGAVQGNVHASFLHTHWAAFPEIPQRFVDACR